MNAKSILITGAAGFMGRALVQRFLTAGWKVYGAASAPGADSPFIPFWAGAEEPGTTEPPDDLMGIVVASGPGPALETDDSRHLEGLGRILAWARHYQVPRIIYVSVLGAAADDVHPLRRVKAQGEVMVAHSDVAWTVVRPSLLFGRGAPLFERLEAWATRPVSLAPASPAAVQPVFVGDIAEAVLRIVVTPATVGRVFDCPGPHLLTMRELIRQMAADSVWWQRRVLPVEPEGRVARMVRWPWSPGEWLYFQSEPRVRDSQWLLELGILPRSLSVYYAPFGRSWSG